MNKKELVAKMARRTSLTQRCCEAVLNAALETITGELARGGCVRLKGLGAFERRRWGNAGRPMFRPGETLTLRCAAAHSPGINQERDACEEGQRKKREGFE